MRTLARIYSVFARVFSSWRPLRGSPNSRTNTELTSRRAKPMAVRQVANFAFSKVYRYLELEVGGTIRWTADHRRKQENHLTSESRLQSRGSRRPLWFYREDS